MKQRLWYVLDLNHFVLTHIFNIPNKSVQALISTACLYYFWFTQMEEKSFSYLHREPWYEGEI